MKKLLLSLTLLVALSPLKATMSDWFLKNYKVLAATTAGVSIVGRGIWAKYVQNKIIKSYQLPHKIKVGIAENGGSRPAMEDTHSVYESNRSTIVGIYDGHGGPLVAQWLKNNFAKRLADSLYPNFWSIFFRGKQAALKNPAEKIHSLFLKVDKELLHNPQLADQGSTATCAIINNRNLTIAHVGDSRAVLVSINTEASGAMAPDGYRNLTKDHKANDVVEKVRIISAGGTVVADGVMASDGRKLAVSRAFGDKKYKKVGVSADPKVLQFINTRDKYVIIASDGIWDAIESKEAADIVRNNQHKDPTDIAHEILIRAAIAPIERGIESATTPIERGIKSATTGQTHKLLTKLLTSRNNLPPENDPNYQAAVEKTVEYWQNLRDTDQHQFIERALACARDNQTVAVVPLT